MHPQTHLLLLLLQNEGRDVRFENGVFSFQASKQEWANLENLNLLHKNGRKLTERGWNFQPVANAYLLDNSGLNTMLLKALEAATTRLNSGKCRIQNRTEDALVVFLEAYNKALVAATYQEDLPAEIQAAVDVLEQEIQEEQKEEVVEKEKKTRKKKTV